LDKDYIDETKKDIVDETSGASGSGKGPDMKYCPHCGKLKPASSKFCPECGKDRYGTGAGGAYQQPQFGSPYPAYAGQPMRGPAVPVQRSGTGLAVAALIIALLNFFMFASFLSFMAVPAVFIFAIMALKRKNGGKVMAIVSIVIAVISALIFAMYVVIIVKLVPDIQYFADHDKEIVAEYELTGEAPEHFDKYRDSKYDSLWKSMGYDDFDDFFGMIIEEYKKSMIKEDPDYFGKTRTKKKIKKSETTTEPTTVYERDSEDLVVLS
jgi:hypothetical protein